MTTAEPEHVLTARSGRIRQARKLTRRSGREKAGLFLAEGRQAVREAIGAGLVIEIIMTLAAHERHGDVVAEAAAAGIDVHHAADDALAELSETVTPQGLVAICRSLAVPFDEFVDSAFLAGGDVPGRVAGLIAVLVEAREPGNAGTVIRCADAAGADAVVLTRGSVDPQGGKAVRASAGSLFHVPICTGAPVEEVVDALRGRGWTVLAADGAGEYDLDVATDQGSLARPTAWLFGNEAHGLPGEVAALADHVVRVPIYGRAESLNLAAAAAVCLYASARAQRAARRERG